MNLDSIKSVEYFLTKDISQQPLSIKQLDEKAEQHKLSAIDFTNHVHRRVHTSRGAAIASGAMAGKSDCSAGPGMKTSNPTWHA